MHKRNKPKGVFFFLPNKLLHFADKKQNKKRAYKSFNKIFNMLHIRLIRLSQIHQCSLNVLLPVKKKKSFYLVFVLQYVFYNINYED